ncbi:hypothetical protein EDF68_10685 [Ochrobactrum sp. BH3]|nr:hypothetical protein EDF68_10685 [Ochrobactrum sp. BH3]
MKRALYNSPNYDDPVEHLVRPAYGGGVQPLTVNLSQGVCRLPTLIVEVQLTRQMLVVSVKGEGN